MTEKKNIKHTYEHHGKHTAIIFENCKRTKKKLIGRFKYRDHYKALVRDSLTKVSKKQRHHRKNCKQVQLPKLGQNLTHRTSKNRIANCSSNDNRVKMCLPLGIIISRFNNVDNDRAENTLNNVLSVEKKKLK